MPRGAAAYAGLLTIGCGLPTHAHTERVPDEIKKELLTHIRAYLQEESKKIAA